MRSFAFFEFETDAQRTSRLSLFFRSSDALLVLTLLQNTMNNINIYKGVSFAASLVAWAVLAMNGTRCLALELTAMAIVSSFVLSAEAIPRSVVACFVTWACMTTTTSYYCLALAFWLAPSIAAMQWRNCGTLLLATLMMGVSSSGGFAPEDEGAVAAAMRFFVFPFSCSYVLTALFAWLAKCLKHQLFVLFLLAFAALHHVGEGSADEMTVVGRLTFEIMFSMVLAVSFRKLLADLFAAFAWLTKQVRATDGENHHRHGRQDGHGDGQNAAGPARAAAQLAFSSVRRTVLRAVCPPAEPASATTPRPVRFESDLVVVLDM